MWPTPRRGSPDRPDQRTAERLAVERPRIAWLVALTSTLSITGMNARRSASSPLAQALGRRLHQARWNGADTAMATHASHPPP
jgi:hypothetical protein